jgi:hypothetical protein
METLSIAERIVLVGVLAAGAVSFVVVVFGAVAERIALVAAAVVGL